MQPIIYNIMAHILSPSNKNIVMDIIVGQHILSRRTNFFDNLIHNINTKKINNIFSRFDDREIETFDLDIGLLNDEDNLTAKIGNYFFINDNEINIVLSKLKLFYHNNLNLESYYNVSYDSGKITIIYGLSGDFYRNNNSIEDAIQLNGTVEHSFNERFCRWLNILGFDFDFSETNYENNCKSLNKIMEKCNEIEDLKAWFTPPCDINEPCLQYIFSKNKLLDLTEKIEFSWGTKKYMLCFYYNISNIKGGYVFSKYEI